MVIEITSTCLHSNRALLVDAISTALSFCPLSLGEQRKWTNKNQEANGRVQQRIHGQNQVTCRYRGGSLTFRSEVDGRESSEIALAAGFYVEQARGAVISI